MTKIKICGLKRKEDIKYVNELQPDYVGFVFAKSSRQVNLDLAMELIKDLDKSIKKVGIFLNQDEKSVKHIAKICRLDVLQFHGNETPEYCSTFQHEVWKAFRIKGTSSLAELEKFDDVDGHLLDSYTVGSYGGSGKAFNWMLGKELKRYKKIILAGGLNPENVRTAIEAINPDIVDVSSGVEENGVKDFHRIKKIIKNVRG